MSALPTAAEGVSDADVALVETRAALRFGEAGYRVLDRAETARQARRHHVTCADLVCAGDVAEALAVTWILRVRLWSTGPAVRQVVLRVVDANGVAHEGAGDVAVAGGLEAAVDAAVDEAAGHIAGVVNPVTFYVHGTPVGAAVVIDGQPAGTLPWTGELTPGAHELAVSATDFDSIQRTMEVTSGGRVVVELVRSTGHEEGVVDPPVVPPTRSDSWPSFVLGGGLIAAGIGITVPAWLTLGQAGQCADADPAGCRTFVDVDGRAGLLWAVGAALLVAGVVLLATEPLSIEVAATPSGAHATLRGSF